MELYFEVLRIVIVLCISDVQGYDVVNCYWADTGMAAFQQKALTEKTTIKCMEKCKFQNYKYTGTRLGSSYEFLCFCGNDIQFTTAASGSECNFPCPKVINDKCGGFSRIAVYDVEFDTFPIQIPASSETTTALHDSIFQNPAQSTETEFSLGVSFMVNTAVQGDRTSRTTSFKSNSKLETTTENQIVRHNITTLTVSLSSTNSQSETVSNNDCLCPCESVSTKWDFLKNMSFTYDELKVLMEDHLNDLEKNIAIDKKQTSLYLNKKRSMPDHRTSARTIGFVGILIILLYVLIIIGSDIANLVCTRSK